MKKIGDIVNLGDFKQRQIQDDNERPFTIEDVQFIHKLFDMLSAIFPAFRAAWPTQTIFDNAKIEWMKAFRQAGITSSGAIERGLNRFRLLASPFVPSPGQFIAMCEPSIDDLNCPDVDRAYAEACCQREEFSKKKWSHPAIKHAAAGILWELKTEPKSKSRPLFERRYMESLKIYSEGKLHEQLSDERDKSDELKKQNQSVKPQFENVRSCASAMQAMKDMLGK
jgi:hypothetical protein